MGSKQAREETDVDELLDTVDKSLDRLKTLYEQYFLGIQKQAPSFIHNDIERKLRDLAQMQLRNTGLRYRLATLQQKFGSYNSYWRRTLRQIENGTYARQLSKIGRDAARSGADIPDEILARMPKRMRDQVIRDREQALAVARRHHQVAGAPGEGEPPDPDGDFVAMIKEPTELRRRLKGTDGPEMVTSDEDFDIDAFFAEVEQHDDPPRPAPPPRGRAPTRPPVRSGRSTSTPPAYDDPDRPRSTTRNDLRRAVTEPATPSARATPPALKQPGPQGEVLRAPPPVPARAVPRPATDLGEDAPTNPTAVPLASGPPPASPRPGPAMASQQTRRNPIIPGAAAARGSVAVESLQGPFPRPATPVQGVPAEAKPAVARGVVPPVSPPPFSPGAGGVPRAPSGSATPSVGVPAIPRPPGKAATPSAGVPAIPRPPGMAATPSTGIPAIPRPPGMAATPSTGIPAIPRPPMAPPPLAPPATPSAVRSAVAVPRPLGAVPSTSSTGPHPAVSRAPGAVAPEPPPAIPRSPVTAPGGHPVVARPGAPVAPGAPIATTATTTPRPGAATPTADMTGPHPQLPRSAAVPGARPTPPAGVPAIPAPGVIATKTPPSATRTPAGGVPIKPAAAPRPVPAAPQKPPPGMTDADVNALYAKYIKAKEMVGEKIGPGEHGKLLKTINAQAPKIMEQYKAKAVDFSVVVKDNQVIIRAKPKT